MRKLMKYEFRKQLFTKLAMLAILALLECYFLYGLARKAEQTTLRGAVLLVVFSFIAVLFVSFESIFTFYNDLKTKQSYMLFMVPESTYSVVGAKVLSAMLQIILTALFIGAVAFADVFLMVARFGEIEELLRVIRQILTDIFRLDIDIARFALQLFALVLSWVAIVVVAMLAITFGATLMANSRLRGVVSFVFFIVLDVAATKLRRAVIHDLSGYAELVVGILVSLLVSAAAYAATAWMLEKKVCV